MNLSKVLRIATTKFDLKPYHLPLSMCHMLWGNCHSSNRGWFYSWKSTYLSNSADMLSDHKARFLKKRKNDRKSEKMRNKYEKKWKIINWSVKWMAYHFRSLSFFARMPTLGWQRTAQKLQLKHVTFYFCKNTAKKQQFHNFDWITLWRKARVSEANA